MASEGDGTERKALVEDRRSRQKENVDLQRTTASSAKYAENMEVKTGFAQSCERLHSSLILEIEVIAIVIIII